MGIDGQPRPRSTGARILVYLALVAGALLALAPLLYMVSTSLKSLGETLTRVSPIPFSPRFWPTRPRWSNYLQAWNEASFSRYFRNSIVISGVIAAGTLATSSLAAYAFARIRFAGRRELFVVLLVTLIMPESVYLVPNFIVITRLGWYDRLAGLTVPLLGSAFSIFLLRQFFSQLPGELLEAARIDGAGHLRSFLAVVLPLSRAPLATTAFLAVVGAWNALQWPLVATGTERWRPIAVGLATFVSEAGPQDNLRMAGAIIATVPVLAMYLVAQRQLTEAISRTGLTG